MRLIDADAIHINIEGGRMNGKVEFAKAIEEAIKEVPTIEAIPVVWITKHIGELIAQDHPLEASHFAEILSLWREEQC